MAEVKENPKEKFKKLFQEIRSSKTESNLQKIYTILKENKSDLLNNDIIPFQFSNDLTWFLCNNIIDLKTQSEIFKLYIDSFFTFKVKPENLQKLSVLNQIFKYDSFIYKSTSESDDAITSIGRYFDKYFPKKKGIKYKVGDIVEVFIKDKILAFVQLPIKKIENEFLILEDRINENKEVKILKDSFKIQEKNTFISEEEINWRNHLEIGMKIDFLNNKNYWVEAKILNILSDNVVLWPIDNQQGDNAIVSIDSPLIKPLNTFSFKYEESEKQYFKSLNYNAIFSSFSFVLPMPKVLEGQETNFLVPYIFLPYHSLFYFDLFNYFLNKLIHGKYLEESNEDNLTIEYIYKILEIINRGEILNQLFFRQYFMEKMLPVIKKVLLKTSLDKKRNISLIQVTKITEHIIKIGYFCSYLFQQPKFFLEFFLNFGFNCFKESENLEKRIAGLNTIISALNITEEYLMNKLLPEYINIIYQSILSDDKDFFKLLFNKPDVHEQLILKGKEIVLCLFKENLLDTKDINKLYNFAISSQEEGECCKQLYLLLTQITKDIPLELSQNMLEKIMSYPMDQIRREDINLLFSLIEFIKKEKDYKKTIKEALDYIYKYIITDMTKGKNYIHDFCGIISSLTVNSDEIYFYNYYLEKIINELLQNKNLNEIEFFYDFISFFILSFNLENKAIMKNKFINILLSNNNSKKLLDNLIGNIEKDKDENNSEKKIKHILAIIDSIQSLLYYTEYKYFFTTDSIMILCDMFIFNQKYNKNFVNFLGFLRRNDLIKIEDFCEKFFKKFDEYIDEINKNNYYNYFDKITEEYAETVLSFYKTINHINTDSNKVEFIDEKCFIKNNPLNFKYFNVIWKMFTKIDQPYLMKEFFKIFSLRLFTPKERYEIWQIILKKIFDEQDKFVQPIIALNMINYIINISEKYGTGGVVPHFLENIKKIPIKLRITSKIPPFPDFELTENIYTTSNLYDVKKEIQKKFCIDPILISFSEHEKDYYPYHESDTGSYNQRNDNKYLYYLFKLENTSNSSLTSLSKEQLEKKYNLIMEKSDEEYYLKKYKLIDDNNPNQFNKKTLSVLKAIFNKETKNEGKMDKNCYLDFCNDSTRNCYKSIDSNLYNTFQKYDSDKKGFWIFDNFIEFFLDSYKEYKYTSIYTNFSNLGYRNDLELFNTPLDKNSPLFYEENNVCEYMPRYFIGNNLEYMNKLFDYSKSNDKTVHELAQTIIKDLCTMAQMSNLFFEKNEKIINDLLEKDNIEMRTYAFNIILSELEKNKEIDNKDIQIAINDFIEKNLEKIINNLNSYINNINEEILKNKYFINNQNTQFIQFLNYYHIIIQIILFSLRKLINNEELFQLVQKVDNIVKNKEKIIYELVSTFTSNIKKENLLFLKKINYEALFNIVISYLIIQKEKIKTVVIDIQFSFSILLLIFFLLEILDTNDNNTQIKQNIYNNYIMNLFSLSKNAIINYRSFLHYSNKFILILKQNDKSFISLIKDEMTKEILKYETLNEYLLTRNYIFTIFHGIIDITFKKEDEDNNNKLFDLFKSLIEIITNKNILLIDILISEYLELINLIIEKLKEANYKQLYEYDFNNLLLLLINDYIISTKNNANKTYSKYYNLEYTEALFEVIKSIISIDPNKYIFSFFINDDIKNIKTKHLSKLIEDKTNYNPKIELKNEIDYLGLKNPSSLCYMNSVIQQLYMIPIFRKSILNLKINEEEYKLNEKDDLDDLLFQLIKMFYYLTYSDKSYYDPKQFVYSFKDYEGNPTNPNLQCDAQEFLTRFVEKIEERIKTSAERFLFNNIFGGTTLQQIICTNPECKNISERREKIIYLSLDIKGYHKLEECLDKFIAEEKIEDYHCEKCDKKITNIKKVLIDKLPNILIIHLQRIAFNYTTFLMDKINDEISFELNLNIKKYTVDKNNKDVDTENYEYEYIGVIIHSGTAQYGHYYSIINIKSEYKMYKFNDTAVTEMTSEKFKQELNYNSRDYFPNAYMLLFQKKIKNPVIVNVREITENSNILNLLKDDKITNIKDNEINYEVYKDEKEAIEKNINNQTNNKEIILRDNKLIGHLISYDNAVYYIDKINENNKKEKIPFKSIILEENIKFCNDKKIFSYSFAIFIKNIVEMVKSEIEKNNSMSDNYIPIIKLFNDYLLTIFSISWYKDRLEDIINNMLSIITHMPTMLSYLIKDIIELKKEILLHEYFLTKDPQLGEAFSIYFGKILSLCIEENIENETAVKIIDFYMEKIPVEISKNWQNMEFFNNFICVLVENSEKIKKKFLKEEILSKLIDFILGKESPLYQGDDRVDNKNIQGKLGPLVKSIALLYQYYINNKDKDENLKISEQDEKMINYMPFYEKIILDKYEEEGTMILIKIKLDTSLNTNELMDKEAIDILIKLKIPSGKSIDNIISSLSLIDKILTTYKDKNEEQKKILMSTIFGIPTILVENDETKIGYVSGAYFNYYSILNYIESKKEINDEIVPLLLHTFKLLYKYPEVYNYLNKLPAPNSFTYSFGEYFIKLYTKAKEKIDNININFLNDEEKKMHEELNILMVDFCKKYDINLDKITNDERICIWHHMFFFFLKYIRLAGMKGLSSEISKYIESYEDKIKVFYLKFKYYLTPDINKSDFSFFTDKEKITYNNCSNNSGKLSELHLPKHSIEGFFIQGNKDCNLSFSLEPYINNMEVSIKKNEKYFLLIKKYDLIDNDEQNFSNDVIFDYDINKLKINEIKKANEGISDYSENNKIQTNENAFVINCSLCGTPNTIDEDNQNFTCLFCSSSLL